MISHKRFNLLVGFLPIIYLIHNADEWFGFSSKIDPIANYSPNFAKDFIVQNPSGIETIFGFGLIVATLAPLIVSLAIWNKPTKFNIKLLVVIAFATLINGFSHVSSSLALGIIGPGLTTGILLCIPFSVLVIVQVYRGFNFTFKEYSLFIIFSVLVYILAIAFSWIIGFGVYKLVV